MPATSDQKYWPLRLEKTCLALQNNGFAATVHASAAEAARHVLTDIVPKSASQLVGFGGSKSVIASGVVDMLKKAPGLTVLDSYDSSISREQVIELRRQSLLADLFLTSSNAVIVDGRLLNLDKVGNRIAAMHFGPKKVALIVGRNKICSSLEDAKIRIKDVASPMNAMRIGCSTPCVAVAKCMDCKSPDRICNVWTLTEKCFPRERIHVLLVDEVLGF